MTHMYIYICISKLIIIGSTWSAPSHYLNQFWNIVNLNLRSELQWNLNTLRPRKHGHHFADDTFNRIFVNENVRIPIKYSLKCVPKGPINNIPALVQIMAWRRPGDKPLSEPVMVSLLTHICVTRPQWVKWNSYIFIQENAFENVLCKMAAILSPPQCVEWDLNKLCYFIVVLSYCTI